MVVLKLIHIHHQYFSKNMLVIIIILLMMMLLMMLLICSLEKYLDPYGFNKVEPFLTINNCHSHDAEKCYSSSLRSGKSMNDAKIAIITSIYGNYDNLKEHDVKNKNLVDWYCFTDNKSIKSTTWNIITEPYHLLKLKKYYKQLNKKYYNMMSSKFYKVKTHEINILKKYDYFIWIDGSIYLQNNFIENINKIIKNNDNIVIHFKHSARNNIVDECYLSMNMSKYKNIDLYKQLYHYIEEGFPDDIGLFENTIIVRKNESNINDVFDSWFKEMMKYGFQDQISLPFIYWKFNIKPFIINENVFNNKNYSYVNYDEMKNH
jgi:hypothetical protein